MLPFADKDVSLRDLEAVLAVYELRQFTRASQVLGRPQPSISHSVQNVEASLQMALFDRHARPVKLTPQSRQFLYELRKGLFYVQRAFSRIETKARPVGAVLKVGHSVYFDGELLVYLANMGKTLNTGFTTAYYSSCTVETVANVLGGVWDCGFVMNPGDICGLDAVPVMRDSLGVLVANTHPLARQRVLHLQEIANEPLIVPARNRNPALRSWLLEQCATAGFMPEITHEITHPQEAAMLAEQRIGVALATRATAKGISRGMVVFRPFAEPQLAIEMRMIMLPGAKPSALLAFVDLIEKMKRRIEEKT